MRVKIGISIILIFFAVLNVVADDWPMFMHDSMHTGVSDSKAPDEPYVLWRYETVGRIASPPVVSDGKVFVGSLDTNVYVLDESTGELIWTYRTMGMVEQTPIVSNGKVFVSAEKDKIYCLDSNTGELIWSYFAQRCYSPPTVANGKLFVPNGEELLVLNEDNGELLWKYKTHFSGRYAYKPGITFIYEDIISPAISNGRVFIGSDYGNVYCIDESSGKLLWLKKLPEPPNSISGLSIGYGKLFVNTFHGDVFALNQSDGALLWSYHMDDIIDSYPAVHDGKVFITSTHGSLYCLEESTGKLVEEYEANPYSVIYSPVIADNKVIFGASNGNLYVLDETTGKLIWNRKLGGTRPDNGIVMAPPAVADGKIFITTFDGRIYALSDPTYSYIKISSTPENAKVYMDNEYMGETPLKIDTTAEYHIIKLTRKGYEDWENEVRVPEEGVNLSINLKRIEIITPATGNVSVRTDPVGAGIYLDGEYKGNTPLKIEDVPRGWHRIKFVKQGYREWVKNIMVTPGRENLVNASLEPIRGTIIVNSEPSRASIFLDGEYIGATPREFYVTIGRHKLELSKANYSQWSDTIDVREGDRVQIDVRLTSQTESRFVSDVLLAILFFTVILLLAFFAWRRIMKGSG